MINVLYSVLDACFKNVVFSEISLITNKLLELLNNNYVVSGVKHRKNVFYVELQPVNIEHKSISVWFIYEKSATINYNKITNIRLSYDGID